MDEVCENVCMSLVFTCTGLRVMVMRYSSGLSEIIKTVVIAERDSVDNQEVSYKKIQVTNLVLWLKKSSSY